MEYTFCPKCAGKLEDMKNYKNLLRRTLKSERNKYLYPDFKPHLQCTQCNFIFYQSSKSTATVILQSKKGEVLLTRCSVEPFKGDWDLPGGFCELNENPEAAAKRKIKEELAVDIELTGILGIYTDKYPDQGDMEYTLNIIYTGKIIQGELRPADDIDAYQWFSLDQLPSNIAFKNGKQALSALKELSVVL